MSGRDDNVDEESGRGGYGAGSGSDGEQSEDRFAADQPDGVNGAHSDDGDSDDAVKDSVPAMLDAEARAADGMDANDDANDQEEDDDAEGDGGGRASSNKEGEEEDSDERGTSTAADGDQDEASEAEREDPVPPGMEGTPSKPSSARKSSDALSESPAGDRGALANDDEEEDDEEDEDDDAQDDDDDPNDEEGKRGSAAADEEEEEEGMPSQSGGGGVKATSKKSRIPAVSGLTIPFRTVKKAMKLDPDIPIVQNEAAVMVTIAAELFLKSLAKESLVSAAKRSRSTIKYEDVAEARTKRPALAFLEPVLP